jgi:DNA-binding Lrp family transcriptional regulator
MTKRELDSVDYQILRQLQKDARTPLEKIARLAGVPKSTIHYRVRRLEKTGFIQGYYAKVDASLLGKDFAAVSLIRGKYGPRYHERLGRKLSTIPGVWFVHFVFGDWDFIVLSRTKSREGLTKVIEAIINLEEVERGTTLITSKIFKEEDRIDFD